MVDYKIETRPVRGDVSQSRRSNVEQMGPDEFLAALDEVLSLPHVAGVKWDQFTPYFSDGDECVFSVNEVRIVFDFPEDDAGERGNGSYSQYELYERDWEVGKGFTSKRFVLNGIDTTKHHETLSRFDNKSGAWESVARENFGDHAEVTATREGFSVEYYEHD